MSTSRVGAGRDTELIENTRAERRREAKATHAQALRRARAERARRVCTAAAAVRS